jgi:hypothetical protein
VAGRRTFEAGEVLTASNINSFLMNQVVAVFDDETARNDAIGSPDEGNVAYLKDEDQIQFYDGSDWQPISGGFTASTAITATDSSWPVPALASTVVKVTVVGGGGGGGGVATLPGTGQSTTFNAGGAGTVTALGGVRGSSTPNVSLGDTSQNGVDGRDGLTAGNGGTGGHRTIAQEDKYFGGSTGGGGEIKIAYLDLDGISTVNVTIGSGGGGGTSNPSGGDGGDGEVIVEYVAA